jgi:hypothetical protein
LAFCTKKNLATLIPTMALSLFAANRVQTKMTEAVLSMSFLEYFLGGVAYIFQ